MKLQIEKLGKVKKAEIKFSGLTLIAGKNDTGKSTAGKVMFAITKSTANWESHYDNEILYRRILFDLRSLVTRIMRKIAIEDIEAQKIDKLYTEIIKDVRQNRTKLYQKYSKKHLYEYLDTIKQLEQILKNKNITEQIDAFKKQTDENLGKTDEYKVNQAVCDYLNFEFKNNIINSLHKDNFKIKYAIKSEEFIDIEGNDRNIEVKFNKELQNAFFKDSAIIDNSLLLDLDLEGNNYCHQDDFLNKVKKAKRELNTSEFNEDVVKDITKILRGASFIYNSNTDRIMYKVSEEASRLELSNAASGAKSFASLLILLKTGVLKKEESLIILDEPENHLHPQWQIDYAECIVKLVEKGFYMLITSHSPDFIYALKYYSKEYKIWDDKVNYYLAQTENENYSRITDVTEKTNEIFKNLAAPAEKLFQRRK